MCRNPVRPGRCFITITFDEIICHHDGRNPVRPGRCFITNINF